MNKNLLYISALSILLFANSCERQLTVETPSKFNKEFVFDSEEYANNAMLGAYSFMGESGYHQLEYVYCQNTDVECNYDCKEAPQNNRLDMFSLRGGLLANFNYNLTIWNIVYKTIDRCNLVIEGLMGKDGATYNALVGEAYTLRAFSYLQGIEIWGDIPYFDYSASLGKELDLPKTDHNVILSKELQHLVDHQANMKWSTEVDEGIERVNRDFCLGLIAKLAMFRAGYGMTKEGVMRKADEYLSPANDPDLQVVYSIDGKTKTAVTCAQYFEMAADYCKYFMSINDRALIADFSEVFMNENKYIAPKGSEVLFEIPHCDRAGQIGYANGANYSKGKQGSAGVQLKFCPSYVFTFDEADTRLLATVGMTKWASDIAYCDDVNKFCCLKWNRKEVPIDLGADSKEGTGINWPIMRYSDVLLMLAEAENEINNGPTALAKEQLKKIRRRAFPQNTWGEKVDAYVDGLNSYEDFFNAIVDERSWEFGGEALRKWDLARWNIYGKKINAAKNFIIKAGRASQSSIVKIEPELKEYTKYADYAYYTKQNNKLTFLNINKKLSNPPSATITSKSTEWAQENWNGKYAKMNMTYSFCKLNKTDPAASTYNANYDLIFCGYKDPTGLSAVPYLMAISATTVANSKYLNNEGYAHVTFEN